jgi:predicted dehydrogenase
MMSTPIRCGLLGLGHAHAFGKLQVLQESLDYEVIGVHEPDDEVRGRCDREQRLGPVRWTTQKELLEEDSIEMIAVESTVPELLGFGRAAIAANKHIHLDKPAGTDLNEFRTLLDEAERGGRIVQMGYMFRYNPGFDFIRQTVRDGMLGDVYSIHASMSTDVSNASRIKLAFHPGGMMFELACHLIDMILLLLGPPKKVTPFLRHDDKRDDDLADNTLAVLEYERAAAIVQSAAMEPNAFPHRRFKVSGTEGTTILEPLEPPHVALCLRVPKDRLREGWQDVEVDDVPRYVLDFEELARCIRGEQSFPYSYEHDFNVQRTVLEASAQGEVDGGS